VGSKPIGISKEDQKGIEVAIGLSHGWSHLIFISVFCMVDAPSPPVGRSEPCLVPP